MKLGLVMTVYNRPRELRRTFDSLSKCKFPLTLEMFIVDDCSSSAQVETIISQFTLPGVFITKIRNAKNEGMFYGLRLGWSHFYNNGFDLLMNLDSDALVKPYWLPILLQLHKLFPDTIVSGFNTLHHPIHEIFPRYCTKQDIGGINMLFHRDLFPIVDGCLGNRDWDWQVCWAMQAAAKLFVVSRPSVVQHIGMTSVAGNGSLHPDIAEDWV